jgi:hypothetical protein
MLVLPSKLSEHLLLIESIRCDVGASKATLLTLPRVPIRRKSLPRTG